MQKVICGFMEFIDEWYKQARMIVTQPKEFFKKMPTCGGFGKPYWFAIVNIFIASVLSVGFKVGFGDMELQQALQYFGIDMLTVLIILIPIALVLGSIGLFLFSGLYHLFLKLVGAKNNYEATFRVFAYISVFNIFTTVSNIDNPLAVAVGFLVSLYVIYVMISALKEVHEISFLRSAIAVILPGIIIIIIMIIIVVLVFLAYVGSMGVGPQMDPAFLSMQADTFAGLLKS